MKFGFTPEAETLKWSPRYAWFRNRSRNLSHYRANYSWRVLKS
jgi:hypothetical protein